MTSYTLKPLKEGEGIKKPEAILKRKQHELELLSRRARRRVQIKKNASKLRKEADILTPAKLVFASRMKKMDAKRLQHWLKIKDKVNLKLLHADSHKVIFVLRNMRLHPSNGTAKILKELELDQFWNAKLLPNTLETLKTLQAIKPFVMFWVKMYLNEANLRKLVFKYLRLRPIQPKESKMHDEAEKSEEDKKILKPEVNVDNSMVEERLGALNIICVEDLFYELKMCSNYNAIASHIAPFQLQSLKSVSGIDANIIESGNLKFAINKRIEALL